MFNNLTVILKMIKFSHTVFAMPFALIAAFLAADGGQGGFCPWHKLLLILWCMIWARSAAMTFNRIADAKIDARNPRTADRPIPAGKIHTKNAYIFLAACAILFCLGTALFWKPLNSLGIGPTWFGYNNYWPALLAVPILLFICLYSFTKRFTWASHFWLGASLMLAPVGTWIAICPPDGPAISLIPLTLGLAVLFWTAGFDIIYACQDLAIDRREGLYSLPAKLGMPLSLWISRICHSFTVTALLTLAILAKLGPIYLTAVAATALILICEHLLVIRGKVKLAFDINAAIGLLLAAAAITDILTRYPPH